VQSLHRRLPAERISELIDARRGLSDSEVLHRRARYGSNLIVESTSRGWRNVLKETLRDPMLWFLAGTSAMFAFVDEWIEALIMLVALVPLLGMDAFLNRRTSASVEGLTARLATQATVERSGATKVVDSFEVVPGDLVIVRLGESFPADGVLIAADDIQVDESSLTGESLPVRKAVLPALPPLDTEPSVNGRHWGLAGTRLLTGQGLLRVVYTGSETLYGEIVRSAKIEASGRTPLQESVAGLVSVLVVAASVVCVAVAWVRWQQGHGLLDALLSAVTLAVAALPEEFPIVFAFFMGVGVYRLAMKQALVRRAVVVENIGRVNCICSDKTGTITEGSLRLAHRYAAEGVSESRLVMIGAAASRRETGDPMDIAILDGVSEPLPWTEVARFPYTEGRKRETGIVQESGQLLAAVKGAPEVVIAQCNLAPAEAAGWMARVDAFAREGHKVIACAWRTLHGDQWPGGEPDKSFNFAGVLCFEDPVRPGVTEALRACRSAGIRVVMVNRKSRLSNNRMLPWRHWKNRPRRRSS
jgi:Ca2+-transporting ATPase